MSVDAPSTPTPLQPPRKIVPPRIWGPAVLITLAALAAATAYGYREHKAVRQLTAQKSEMMASLDSTRSLIAALTNRVNELATQENPNKPAASHRRRAASPFRRSTTHHRATDDPRWKEIRSQLAEQQKQIEANRQDLGSARTELQGSIARTHGELVLLEKRGERKYYEFDLDKDSQFRRQGPVGLRLHKANTKHQNADLELMIDDVKLSKKHVNLYEPVFFYSADSKQPVELVIISISKNHIHGYVDESKYKSADLEAMAGSAGGDGAAVPNSAPGAPAPQPRQRLEPPKN